ncbi:MAG: pyridoxamine 5'-phosphate oxidase family protein [Acidobacteria bacterium]|nr:pyridoxamine 5'-phosphate oxidase family protein [Acidobacteriota bacterium]
MDKALEKQILELLDAHRIMTVATLRPDGWPQATTVGYSNEGMTLYFLCGQESQKAANLAKDNRVSVTIDSDVDQVLDIKGLSMAARAERITDPEEGRKAISFLFARYPAQKDFQMEPPPPETVALFQLKPVVISVLDYSKGFAHSELVTV